jgi:predicted MFS family arabinose efflux permease
MVAQILYVRAILADFHRVPQARVAWYLLPLAIGDFCGALLLGSFFDTIGRKKMIWGTSASVASCSGHRVAICEWDAVADHPDRRLARNLLLCLGGREFGISYRQ